ncbi:hypothetical protein TRICHSKD4_0912 [Roseibium sp. TrichSKD4]|uniref:hypothetical protein n=1 Tax=Roseibium sp. TrichSKD4 TaxID=744980 RepID=UPI0001E5623F|nr:hypothetical protein [Roseibium sp. TrichSKD4]EFO33798.1 hypothetical protein TRICHSKD4_0912 [Roseibium sp. TrichSKD4]
MPAEKIKDTTQAEQLCKSLDIKCLPSNAPHRISQVSGSWTNAVLLIQRQINRHGERHTWAVLYALTQTENHKSDLTSAMIGAISDLFCRYPNWLERLGEFCDALDAIDLAELRTMAKQGPGIDGKPPKQRMLLAGYLQYLLEDIMEPPEQKEMPLWMTG